MTGDEIREARERAGMTQADLAGRVGVSLRTIGNWERGENVPRGRMGRIEEVLGHFHRPDIGGPLMSSSDTALVAELARRLDAARRVRSGEQTTLVSEGVDELIASLREGPRASSPSVDPQLLDVADAIRARLRVLHPDLPDDELSRHVTTALTRIRRLPTSLLVDLALGSTPDLKETDDDARDAAPNTQAGGSPAAEDYTLAAMDRDDSEEIEAQQNEP